MYVFGTRRFGNLKGKVRYDVYYYLVEIYLVILFYTLDNLPFLYVLLKS